MKKGWKILAELNHDTSILYQSLDEAFEQLKKGSNELLLCLAHFCRLLGTPV